MSLEILFYVLGDLRWQLMTLLVAATCAGYSLEAIWAAQSRDHWITRGLIVCGLLALLLPPRAYEPLLFFLLMLPVLGALTAWQTWRIPAPNDTPRRPFQFSLRTLLLCLALVSAMLGLTLAALRQGLYIEWLRLPFAAALIAVLANQAWCLVTARRKILQTVILAAAILAWVCAEEFWLEDWLRVGNLFGVMHIPMLTNHSLNMVLLTIHYTEFSLLIALGGAIAKGAWPSSASRRKQRAWRIAAALALAFVSVPIGWLYVQLVTPTNSMPPFAVADNCYPELLDFARAAPNAPPSQAKFGELVKLLERPGAVPLDLERDATAAYSGGMSNDALVLRDLSRSLQSAGDKSVQAGKQNEAAEYALANARMGLVLQRGGLQIHFLVGNAIEGVGQSSLAKIRDKLSAAERRRLIGELRRVDRQRESISQIEQRDRIFDDRTIRWQHRLQTVLLSRPVPEGAETQHANFQLRTVTYSRLLAADLAVRSFAEDKGRLPSALGELVPGYLPSVPEDPFSGQPLLYRPVGRSFVLYSVGQDRQDDGGNCGNHAQSMFEVGYDLDIDTMLRPNP
jgi:hypothetical protein